MAIYKVQITKLDIKLTHTINFLPTQTASKKSQIPLIEETINIQKLCYQKS